MKRITKIRIPKGTYCGKCKFNIDNICRLYTFPLWRSAEVTYANIPARNYRTHHCKKNFPNGAVFVAKDNDIIDSKMDSK
ncbi:hypothetical protein ES707_22694 [subsurface metagenome]